MRHPSPRILLIAESGRSILPALLAGSLILLQTTVVYGKSSGLPPNTISSIPLPSQPSTTPTHFQALTPDRTGIDFTHRWTPPAKYAHELPNPCVGGGVCIGDYDKDGKPDIFLTRPFGGNRLYRNLGDFRFIDVTRQANLESPETWGQGASFADIDNDGDQDLFVCGYDCPNLLYINQGNGTFVENAAAAGLAFNGASIMVAFADYDIDGDLDAYLVTYRIAPRKNLQGRYIQKNGKPVMVEELREQFDLLAGPDQRFFEVVSGQYDHLYENNGDGTFSDVSKRAFGESAGGNDPGNAAMWWDYNDDRLPDLYIANDFAGPDRLLQNNGDGTFNQVTRTCLPHTPWMSMGVDAADINNDGLIDFMGTDMSGTSHYKQKVSMGDMTQNGWFLEWAIPRQYMRNAVYLNSGTPRFLEAAYLTGLADTDWTWSINFADFDNDGWVDLFASNGMTGDWSNSDFAHRTGISRDKVTSSSTTKFGEAPPKRESNLAFRNQGNLSFTPIAKTWRLDHEGISFGSSYVDLDRDGDLDLVVNNFGETVSVYRNKTEGPHRISIRLRGTRSHPDGIGAKIMIRDGDNIQVRHLFLTHGFMSSGEPVTHFGLGDRRVIKELVIHWPSGHLQKFSNLDADHEYTITEPDKEVAAGHEPSPPPPLFTRLQCFPRVRHREKPFNDYAIQPLLPYRLSQLGPGMAWGDVNADDLDDLYIGGAAGSSGSLLINQGGGRFEKKRTSPFKEHRHREDMAPLFFDIDSDGDLDLYVVSGGVEFLPLQGGKPRGTMLPAIPELGDRLYLNDGQGSFRTADEGTIPANQDSGSVAAAADFDGDGDLDLFVGGRFIAGQYPATPNSRLLRNQEGRLVEVTDEVAPGLRKTGLVTSALWSDADDDGDPDLIVTHEWGPVKLFSNKKGHLEDCTAAAGLAERLGWYNGIAGRDIDADGDIDYVVTNVGLNTKYHATPERPAMLYYGDFAGDGIRRLVEAEFENANIFPVRGKSCSQNAMPFVGKQCPTFHQFAISTITQIYGPEALEKAQRFEADTLQSGVLINDGSATFSFQPLPRVAQISPAFGAVMTDVDGDGQTDLYLAQNFFSPQRETGNMDGGVSLLLRGQGNGRFTPVWPNRSGLLVAGDAKGLTCTDFNEDGWVDFAVAVNDSVAQAFENKRSPAGRAVTIRLRGKPGNPTGIGARVTIEREGKTPQTDEIRAGGGYLSQSSPELTFGLGPDGNFQRIRIRWPDGRETFHVPGHKEKRILIEQPG